MGRTVRAGTAGGDRPAAPPASGRRTVSPSSTRTASSTSRSSTGRPSATPCVSTSTGAWRHPRWLSSSTTRRPRCSSSAPTSFRVLDAHGRRSGARPADPGHRRTSRPPAATTSGSLPRPTTIRRPRRRPDDVALQLYSSGTTGRPKGVMLSNHNLIGLLPDRRRGVGHDGRLGGPRGDAAVPHRWQWMGQRRPTTSVPAWKFCGRSTSASSSACSRLAGSPMRSSSLPSCSSSSSSPESADADFSSLEVIVYGASPISEEVLAASITLFGCRFFQVYGLTETTGAITHLPPSDHDGDGPTAHRLRSCGLPGPGVELRIVDVVTGADVVEPRSPGGDPRARPAGDEGVLEQPGGDERGDRRGRVVPFR